MAIRKEKLESYRKLLTSRREILAQGLRQVTADLIDDDVSYSDAIDQATADADRSLALQIKNRERNTLTQIDEALNRIDQGAYGECAECAESISEGRIKAFPFTTLCIDCKAELESETGRYPGRA